MEEEHQDVQVDPSTTEEIQEVVNTEALESDQQEQSVEQTQETQSQPPAQEAGQTPVISDFDESGVPWKNRAMEAQRKLEKSSQDIAEMKEMMAKLQQGQQQKPQYTEAELQAYIADERTSSANRALALRELDKLREQRTANVIKKEIGSWKQEQEAQVARQRSLTTVYQRHPEAFIKNNTGQIVWNQQSPMYQRIAQYMQNPEIGNNPRGLIVAASMAYSDLSLDQSARSQQQQQQLKRQVKKLQKSTMVEGGGKRTQQAKTPVRKAIDDFAKSKGKVSEGTIAMKEWLKAKGTID